MITREQFVEEFNKYISDDLFYNLLDASKFVELEDFIIYLDYDMDQITILERGSLRGVSWYKFMHIGRALETSGIEDIADLDDFLKDLSENLKKNGSLDIISGTKLQDGIWKM